MPAFAPRLPSYAAPRVNDPTAGIYSLLLNPQMNTMEVDTTAAEAAIAGGFGGSQFGINNMARLRDSERIAREVTGQELLQPYLERASREGLAGREITSRERLAERQAELEMGRIGAETQSRRELAELEQAGALERLGVETASRTALEQLQQGGEMTRQREQLSARENEVQAQIAADSARIAIEQAGLERRLTSEQQTQLQRALLEGDQRMQQLILSEAGATGRQRESIAADLNNTMLQLNERRFESLLGLASQDVARRGAASDGRVAPPGTNFVSTGGAELYNSTRGPRLPSGGSGANGDILSRVDTILRRYGLS